MLLQEILDKKGSSVYTISPQATLEETVQELVRCNVGSLLVRDADGDLLGIITERDVVRMVAKCPAHLAEQRVEDVMSQRLICAAPDDQLATAMRLMTGHRIRHLPIMLHGELCGIVSIGDIVKASHSELERENHYMRSYIQGEATVVVASID